MTNAKVRSILKSTCKSLQLQDERGHKMRFPTRQDYIRQLQQHGLISNEAELIADHRLTEAVYLDWLRRPQIGCEFAQLLAHPDNRTRIRTVVTRESSGSSNSSDLAVQIDRLVVESVNEDSAEALSVLLPEVLSDLALANLIWELSKLQAWAIEKEHLWRGTLMLIGLRVEIADCVVAETLGLGPFHIFPTTRQCPITTLEIRTKERRAKRSHISKTHLAAHLADIDVDDILTPAEFRSRFEESTPRLRKQILGGRFDARAKAGVTYSIPAAIWASLKLSNS